MDVRALESQQQVDGFVSSQPRSQFLQSWAWGESKRQDGLEIRRFGLFDNDQIIGSASIIIVNVPAGKKYWYIPRGPVFSYNLRADTLHEAVRFFLSALSELARSAGALFLRCEPALELGDVERFNIIEKELGIVVSKAIQPTDTQVIDLSPPAEELLTSMHEKTRYNIRLAERKGVVIRIGDAEDLPNFHQLNAETTTRDGFKSHDPSYYDHLYRTLPSDFLSLYLAEYEGNTIAANIVISYGDMTTYLHGTSSDQSRNSMAPHFLQWVQMNDAKKRGQGWYDFWGVMPITLADQHAGVPVSHPWAGITRFKKGFGGEPISYVGTLDIPLKKWWYTAYTAIRRK